MYKKINSLPKKFKTFSFLLLLSFNSYANLRLACEAKNTINLETNEFGLTSGVDYYEVKELRHKKVTIKKDGLGVPFSGLMDEGSIQGKVSYNLPGFEKTFYQTIAINRYTGEIKTTFSIGQETGGLLHTGKCSEALKKF